MRELTPAVRLRIVKAVGELIGAKRVSVERVDDEGSRGAYIVGGPTDTLIGPIDLNTVLCDMELWGENFSGIVQWKLARRKPMPVLLCSLMRAYTGKKQPAPQYTWACELVCGKVASTSEDLFGRSRYIAHSPLWAVLLAAATMQQRLSEKPR